MTDRRSPTKLPDLGSRGEGWVAAQFVLLGLVLILGLLHVPDAVPAVPVDWLVALVGAAELVIGGRWAVRAFRELGPNLTPVPRPIEGGVLVRTGVYAEVRHPIYAGLILGSVGWATLTRSVPAFAVAVLLGLLLDVKSRREEAWLSEKFAEYDGYRHRTKRFLRDIY